MIKINLYVILPLLFLAFIITLMCWFFYEFVCSYDANEIRVIIDAVLENNGYHYGRKKESLKKQLLLDYYNDGIDRYTRIIKRLKQLELEL